MTTIASELPRPPEALSGWLTTLLAMSCGLIVANLYYAQPLIGPIAADLGLSAQSAGLIVTMTQLGYGAGLLLIVPLGDLVENRRLVVGVTSLGALALLAAAFAAHPLPFLIAGLLIGFGSVAVQILIPYAGHLAPAASIRGRPPGRQWVRRWRRRRRPAQTSRCPVASDGRRVPPAATARWSRTC